MAAVTSCENALFDRIVYDQLYIDLVENDFILYVSINRVFAQFIRLSLHALLEATDSWAYDVDRGKVNAVVFLDIKKAFDTANHEILLSKLSNYGTFDNVNSWFVILDDRMQTCSVNVSLSGSCSLSCGVPQGTILRLLLCKAIVFGH